MDDDEKREALRLTLGDTGNSLNLRLSKDFVLRNEAIMQKQFDVVDGLSAAIARDTRLLQEIVNDKIEQLGTTDEVLRALAGLQRANAEVRASIELINNVKAYLKRINDGAQFLEAAVSQALKLV